MKLSSESERRAMQVELANSRKEAAAAAAKLKHELANWQVGGGLPLACGGIGCWVLVLGVPYLVDCAAVRCQPACWRWWS